MNILVCGFGRCGSSLTMQMLKAGGVPCFGDAPAFEPDAVSVRRVMSELLPKLDGIAAKILDPQRSEWPKRSGMKVIWLDRNRIEQAKSQIKMVETFGGFTVPRRSQAIKGMAASLIPDREKCMDLFADIGADVLPLKFEDILESPRYAACAISSFLCLKLPIEAIDAMVLVVRRRRPECRPDMALEAELVEAANA